MIFTVVAYLPLLEEEVAHIKTEFAKKTSAEGNDADSDEESEVESENVFHDALNYNFVLAGAKHCHRAFHTHYFSILDDKSTPPPKI